MSANTETTFNYMLRWKSTGEKLRSNSLKKLCEMAGIEFFKPYRGLKKDGFWEDEQAEVIRSEGDVDAAYLQFMRDRLQSHLEAADATLKVIQAEAELIQIE